MSIYETLPVVFMELFDKHGIDCSMPTFRNDDRIEITMRDYSFRDRFVFDTAVFEVDNPTPLVVKAFELTKRVCARHSQMVN
jgi:hypothetical protein